jgi:hypothetical protein
VDKALANLPLTYKCGGVGAADVTETLQPPEGGFVADAETPGERCDNWLSPVYPVGAYSYSLGIEWGVEGAR